MKENKIGPNRQQNNLFSGRHARPEHGMQDGRDCFSWFRSLLEAAFCTAPDQCSRNRPLFLLLEASASRQPFTTSQRLLPFESHRSEIIAPDLSLSRHPEFSTGPFGCQLPSPRSLISRGRSTLPTRCQFTIQNSQAYRSRPLPIRMFVLLDCSAPLTSDPRGLPSCWPDIPFATRDRRSRIHRPFPGSNAPGSLPSAGLLLCLPLRATFRMHPVAF